MSLLPVKVKILYRVRCSNSEIEKSLYSRLKMQEKKLYSHRHFNLHSNQNLIIKLNNLGYLNFSTTAPTVSGCIMVLLVISFWLY